MVAVENLSEVREMAQPSFSGFLRHALFTTCNHACGSSGGVGDGVGDCVGDGVGDGVGGDDDAWLASGQV